MRQVIRDDSQPLADAPPDREDRVPAPPVDSVREPKQVQRKPRNSKPFRRRRRSRPGRGPAEGQGRAIPCLPPAPGSRFWTPICAPIRPPPALCAHASHCRAPRPPPKSCASTPTTAALRDLRFAVGDPGGPAANLLSLWRNGASRPPSLDPGRILDAAARLDLAVDSNGLAASLRACAGEGDPVSAAANAAALALSAIPDAPAPTSEILSHWVFDMVIAIRLRWPRPVPLIAAKILDPTLRLPGAARRPRPGDPVWPNAAAGAIALAAASALDLAADLSRRSNTLIAVAPKLRSKPAQKIVDLLLAQDCVSPAEAARHAPMTGRAARRLFDRLVVLGAARELSGRPAFRLYGL